jgi:hypothetical protein
LYGKSLLLALVLIAAVAGLWMGFPSGGGIVAGEKGADDGALNRDDGVEAVGAPEDGGEVFSGNVREPVSSASERLAAAAEREAAEARLREMQRRDDEGLVVETMPDGHQSIHLQGRFQHVTRLVEGADGKMVPVCGAYVPREAGEEREAADE